MKEVIFLGKRREPGSPKLRWPEAHLAGTTHSNQKYPKLGPIEDYDSWWDLHPFGPLKDKTGHVFYKGIRQRRPKTYAWYRTLPGPDEPGFRPLYLLEPDPTIRAGVIFPLADVRKEFAIFDELDQATPGGWWTCQVDLMIAYHILLGYEHIILHGHGVSQDVKHFANHRGILYWVGYARGRGVRISVLAPSWYRAPLKAYPVETGALYPVD